MSEARQTPAETPKIRRFLKISLIVGFLAFVNYGGSLVVEQINFQFWPEHERLMIIVLWFAIVLYVLWMALPFVPGIELGLALMVLLGTRGVVLVYLCTLLSLSISFTIGRLIPLNSFARFLGWLHMYKTQDLVLQLEPLNSEEKLDFLLRSAPLNLPGNALIGGGGGIGLISGMSRLYPFPKYILLVSLAITPLPLLFLAGKLPV
jgi:hypothetical protein